MQVQTIKTIEQFDFSKAPYLSKKEVMNLFDCKFIDEKRLHEEFTGHEIISELREMNFKEIKGGGYEPISTRTDFTDALHGAFGFRTDYQIIKTNQIKKIFKDTKK